MIRQYQEDASLEKHCAELLEKLVRNGTDASPTVHKRFEFAKSLVSHEKAAEGSAIRRIEELADDICGWATYMLRRDPQLGRNITDPVRGKKWDTIAHAVDIISLMLKESKGTDDPMPKPKGWDTLEEKVLEHVHRQEAIARSNMADLARIDSDWSREF